MSLVAKLSPFEPYLRSVLRIVAGFNFTTHGLQKLMGWFGGNAVDLGSMLGVAGVLETFGGALILLGLFTRPTAFLLSGQMAVAYFTAHAPQGFPPVVNGGEMAMTYSFLFLWLCAAGPGPLSVDKIMGKR